MSRIAEHREWLALTAVSADTARLPSLPAHAMPRQASKKSVVKSAAKSASTSATRKAVRAKPKKPTPVEPFVVDDGEFLSLFFNNRYTQSRMSLKAPNALALTYTRKMMACLLFQPAPAHIAIIGLGGGSLTKFCYRRLLRSRITTVEIDRQVLAMASMFRVPPPDARLALVHADASEYFARSDEPFDLMLVDGCDERGIAPAFRKRSFYADMQRLLNPGGVLVVNLVGTVARKDAVESLLLKLFDGRVLTLHVPFGGNRLAFAFAGPDWPPDWARVHTRAATLEQRTSMEYESFAEQLERNFNSRQKRRKR